MSTLWYHFMSCFMFIISCFITHKMCTSRITIMKSQLAHTQICTHKLCTHPTYKITKTCQYYILTGYQFRTPKTGSEIGAYDIMCFGPPLNILLNMMHVFIPLSAVNARWYPYRICTLLYVIIYASLLSW